MALYVNKISAKSEDGAATSSALISYYFVHFTRSSDLDLSAANVLPITHVSGNNSTISEFNITIHSRVTSLDEIDRWTGR